MLFEKLTNEERQIVLEEVGYTEERLEADLQIIKEWLKRQDHLPPSRLKETDDFLKKYLTGCKGNLEKVKKKLDAYYTYRSHSEIFECRDPSLPEYQAVQKIGYVAVMPKTIGKKKLTRLAFFKVSDCYNPKVFDFLNFARFMINAAELYMRAEDLSVGLCLIFDYKQCYLTDYITRLRPSLARDLVIMAESILPLRISNLFCINISPVFAAIFKTVVVRFLSKKLKERVIITSEGYEYLWKHLDKRSLPWDYGGELQSVNEICGLWRAKELKLRSWYINELSERTDEAKRVQREDTMRNPYTGIVSSLKKLVVD